MSLLRMAAKAQVVWEEYHGCLGANADRDVMIIASLGEYHNMNPDVVPRCIVEITEDDRRKLTNQGIPEDCCDDLSIIRARISLDNTLDLVKELICEPGSEELSREDVLKCLKDFLQNTTKSGGRCIP